MRDLPRSAWLLLAANLVPLLGVLLLGWRLGEILLLYWLESAVIGVFTILKMLAKRSLGALFYVPFFSFHYGLFMLVHLVFLVALFLGDASPLAGGAVDVARTLRAVGWGGLALVVSHGASFWTNSVRGGELDRLDLGAIMMQPYPRIVVMQLTIIFGAMLSLLLGSPVWALVLLVALKSGVDLRAHLRERARASDEPAKGILESLRERLGMIEPGDRKPTIVVDGRAYHGATGARMTAAEILAFAGKDADRWDLYAAGEHGQRIPAETDVPVMDGATFETRPRDL